MTDVLVLGATGRAGSAILTHLPANLRVTAALRRPGDDERLPVTGHSTRTLVVDITDTASIRHAADVDVIVNAIRLREDIAPTDLIALHRRLLNATGGPDAGPSIVTVGGAGALHLPDGTRFWQHSVFPERTLPRGRAHAQLRDHLESGLAGTRWAFLIPPPAFDPNGRATGTYATWAPPTDEASHIHRSISYTDYAAAVADATTHRWTGTHLVAAP